LLSFFLFFVYLYIRLRQLHNCPKLKLNYRLIKSAQIHSEYLQKLHQLQKIDHLICGQNIALIIGQQNCQIAVAEFISQLKLDHHGKPESIEWTSLPSMGLFSNEHSRSRSRDSNPPHEWGHRYALLERPVLGRNGYPLLPGFPWWSTFNRHINSTIKLLKSPRNPLFSDN
uniref:Endonuclease/exonuclease/phosphatase family protein n=1 Tax=Schistosoma curassoni TaxID=6186 RepID=A0A183L2M4_9TREM